MSHTFHGPLRRCPENPRYFTDDAGRAIYLSGSHTWAVFQDLVPLDGEPSPGQLFDFEDWLAFSKRYGFNFLRLWSREAAYQRGRRGVELGQYLPSRYLEANPGRAPGELPKYDLDRLNPAYFERLRDRVIRAGEQGIYVSVMLFEAWTANPYMGAPLRRPPLQPAEQHKRRRWRPGDSAHPGGTESRRRPDDLPRLRDAVHPYAGRP